MIFKGDSLFKSKRITGTLIDILTDQNRFESIEMSMPDMIMCNIHGSKFLPKSKHFNNNPPIICCSFDIMKGIYFSVVCFENENCEYIIERLNRELPYLHETIPNKINKIATLVHLEILNEKELNELSAISNLPLRYQKLEQQIDMFFKNFGDEIISNIIEIMMRVRVY